MHVDVPVSCVVRYQGPGKGEQSSLHYGRGIAIRYLTILEKEFNRILCAYEKRGHTPPVPVRSA